MKIHRARMMSPTGKPVVVAPVWPSAAVYAWYEAKLEAAVREMYLDSRMVLIPAIENTPVIIARDQALPNAAGVILRVDSRILFVKRTDWGRYWAFPGGGIESGEDPELTARRELREETEIATVSPFRYFHTEAWRGARFATFICDLPGPWLPVVHLNREHSAHIWLSATEALLMLDLHPGVRHTLELMQRDGFGADIAPTKQLQRALEKWGRKWQDKFDLMSKNLSLEFATKSQQATQTQMKAAFKRSGFTVEFKPTPASVNAYHAVAAEQVGLIKSIAEKYHTDVQTQVWESVKRGGDLRTLSQQLEKTYGVTKRRAALIARDQNNKAKAVFEAVRHQEMGIKQAIWMHSHAGKEPRPTHVKMNNKLYNLATGMYDADERKNVHPGELINCRCTMRPYIPGFEASAYPEWEVSQT